MQVNIILKIITFITLFSLLLTTFGMAQAVVTQASTVQSLPLNASEPTGYNMSADAQFWFKICKPALSGLIDYAGTYSAEEKQNHLRFFAERIAPWIGPRPAGPLNDDAEDANPFDAATPVEMSINFTSKRKTMVRFQLEPTGATTGPHTVSEDPLGKQKLRELLASTEDIPGVDLRWASQFLEALIPSDPEELSRVDKAIKEGRLPYPLTRFNSLQIAFDLDGAKKKMKVYFNPMGKQFATGRTNLALTFDTIRSLKPYAADLEPSVSALENYWATCPDTIDVLMTGIDAADPSGSRIKLYTYLKSQNSWNVVRHVWTLGGVAMDEERLQGLETLRSIWDLLINEDKNREDFDNYNKPLKVPESFLGTLLFSFEFKPGSKFPELKVYIPLWQYGATDIEIAKNVAAAFRKLGWEGAADGYLPHLQNTFPGADIDRTASLHSFVSFSYSHKTGAYLSLYYAITGKSVGVSKSS